PQDGVPNGGQAFQPGESWDERSAAPDETSSRRGAGRCDQSDIAGSLQLLRLAGNARKLQSFWNFTQREWKHTLSKRSQKGRLTWEALKSLLEKHPLVPPRIRISYPQLAAYSRL